jgi:O-antigen ligase
LQVTSSATSFTSDFTIQTTAPAGQLARNGKGVSDRTGGNPLALAVLLPGIFGLGLLARKRKTFARTALILTLGMISVLGTSACNARYRYLNHPPTANDGTPTGAYTLTIWAQTSNGVTASEEFVTMPFTVN